MPRILGLEMTGTALTVRILIGSVLALLSFLFLVYLPVNMIEIVAQIIQRLPSSAGLSPSVYAITISLGVLIAILTFVVIVVRGTWIYGPTLIAYGLVFVAYIIALFQGGSMLLDLSLGNIAGLHDFSARLAFNMFGMMLMYALPFIVVVVKGIVVTHHDLLDTGRVSP